MQATTERGAQRTSETFSTGRYHLSRRTLRSVTMFGSMRCSLVILIVAAFMLQRPTPAIAGVAYARMPGYCMKPPPTSSGRCTVDIEGFYYNPRTNDCERYQVGLCRSTPGQSFGSRSDCMATCVHTTRLIKDQYSVD